MLIGAALRSGGAGTYPVVNPSTEQVVGLAPEATAADVADAVAAARTAFPQWSATGVADRAALLRRIGSELRARSAELGALMCAEGGCLLATAESMVERAAQRFDRFADLLLRQQPIPIAAETRPHMPPQETLAFGEISRRPHGVVACITPFNFPLIGAAAKIAPAIAMGNTVVFKPAPQDPLAVLRLGEICVDAGLPAGVVNIISGSQAETGRVLLASPDVDMVSFTGSTVAGTEIYRTGAETMRRMLLELGGKGALIVRKDADLEGAVEALSRVWTYYSGQWCAAPTRAILHRDVHAEVVERLRTLGAGLRLGDPSDPATQMGPVISSLQRDRIEAMIEGAVAAGARQLIQAPTRGGRETGFFVPPALLVDCTPDMEVVQNEVFGPVLSVQSYTEDDEAIALANDSRFGLTSYIYSGDTARAWELAPRLRSGTVLINLPAPHDGLPFGGVGMSGFGRDNGVFALESYSEPQGIAAGL